MRKTLILLNFIILFQVFSLAQSEGIIRESANLDETILSKITEVTNKLHQFIQVESETPVKIDNLGVTIVIKSYNQLMDEDSDFNEPLARKYYTLRGLNDEKFDNKSVIIDIIDGELIDKTEY